ncbi:allergen Bos d 2-like [Delphinapterus leucas]|uniref:Allergen Bos d 2-like n=1 Tax=Delphinapterus leucas TaxID=9749 RepID=A0A7F8K9F9_DELLE|nr:allergen Bos d 2-like [Delphinapterus leucas]
MKILLLVFGLACADQEPPSEEALSKITGEWRTIYIASDDVDKTHENGPLRGHIHRTECSNNCETTYITFYTKNYFQLIIVSKNMLVIYAESIDEDKTTHLTEAWNPAKGRSLSEEEFNKFEELTKDKRVPTENTEDVIATGKVPEANVYPR